ncbi:adenylyltransferase and sulfurtransferase UBA4 [Apiospora rasikravindrae]|uniref:Adenylyltransferase and sulfurtransferase uba4 n=1 Tax=Apiospora rasikravindrae TaxID=990691 RepID=A0ABR1UBH2_9PEZI
MEPASGRAEQLRLQIAKAEADLRELRLQLSQVETSQEHDPRDQSSHSNVPPEIVSPWKWPLQQQEYERYARQLILPSVGLAGQMRLKSAAVLVVGAGGLGCPAAAYLAGAGVGVLGLVDGDIVEVSNLHRQIAHSHTKIGMNKVDSLAEYCIDLNPRVNCVRHVTPLTPENAAEIVSKYDVVLDCTDHPTSRYLISDACVLLQKPLVSASALRTDGQLIVLNNPPAPQGSQDGGPCYRCVFPKPPPPDGVLSCGEGGILGPVVGVMGVLQALEAIKLVAAGPPPSHEVPAPSLLLFSAVGTPTFRSMRMRGRRSDCSACGMSSSLTPDALKSGMVDYVLFCGVRSPVRVLAPDERITAAAYSNMLAENPGFAHVLLDVRDREHHAIASIPGAVNVPFSMFQRTDMGGQDGTRPDWLPESLPPDAPIYVVCRVGNDSQVAARKLKEMRTGSEHRFIGDIQGGMEAWKKEVDKSIPFI